MTLLIVDVASWAPKGGLLTERKVTLPQSQGETPDSAGGRSIAFHRDWDDYWPTHQFASFSGKEDIAEVTNGLEAGISVIQFEC